MALLHLSITDVAAGGDGLARAPDGRVVFVRGAIPGDEVLARVVDDRRSMVRATVEEVRAPSDDRVDPPCPHVSEGCGGCGWQHVDPEAQPRLKVRVAEEALRRIGRLDGCVEPGLSLPATGFRTSLRCLVVGGRVAFRAVRSHDPVAVASCLVAHPGLDDLIAHGHFGDAREVTLRVGAATGERLVLFDPAASGDLQLPADVRLVDATRRPKEGSPSFTDVVHGHRFRISARSFFQTRTDGAAALVDAVRRAGDGRWGTGHLVDLYGGVGLFGACLGEGMTVTDVESNRWAVADARHNLSRLDARVHRTAAATWRPEPADVVVADPPRAGLGAEVVDRIAAAGAVRVVLVSCDPAAFARDARLLTEVGYRRQRTELVDLFPQTPHLELVSRFDLVAPTR